VPRTGVGKKRVFLSVFAGSCVVGIISFWSRPVSVEETPAVLRKPQISAVRKKTVEREVTALNQRADEERQHFEAQGWEKVDAEKPDMEVVDLDPAALARKEALIADQLMSGSFAGERLSRIHDIALQASEERTRYAAIDALGRSHDRASQSLLMDLYRRMDRADARAQIVPLLRPDSLDGDEARFLLDAAATGSTPHIRGGALGSLAVLCLRLGHDASAVASRLPSSTSQEFTDVYDKLRNGSGAHKH
jgi:hypothetical protein